MSSKLSKNALLSVGQTIAAAALLVLLYRAMVNELGLELIGLWSTLIALCSFGRAGEFGMAATAVRWVARAMASEEKEKAAHVIWLCALMTAVGLSIVFTIAIPAILYAIDNVPSLTPYSQQVNSYLVVIVVATFFNALANVFLGAIDGCQRFGIRVFINVGANTVFTVGAIALMPTFKFSALPWLYLLQSIVLMTSSLIAVRSLIPIFDRFRAKASVKEMVLLAKYGLNVQMGGIALLFFDPITKIVLAAFGGLSHVGAFELASRLVMYMRSILVSAFMPLVPAIAALSQRSAEMRLDPFRKGWQVLGFIVPPYFASAIILMPLISWVWLGHVNERFVLAAWFACIGWAVNAFAAAAYMANLGSGNPGMNTVHHIICGALNLTFASAGGVLFGPIGVLVGNMIALSLGSIWLIRKHAAAEAVSLKLNRATTLLTIFSAVMAATAIAIHIAAETSIVRAVILLSVVGAAGMLHPLTHSVFRLLRVALRKGT
jgi:O-antigen/teichoic acid export membrane protein